MEDFEHRYQWYLTLLRDDCPHDIAELQTVEWQLRRLNRDFEYADLVPGRRMALTESRNEAMALLAAAVHHSRIDDALAVNRSDAAHRAISEERRRFSARQQKTRRDREKGQGPGRSF